MEKQKETIAEATVTYTDCTFIEPSEHARFEAEFNECEFISSVYL